MNFISTFDELNKLYEAIEEKLNVVETEKELTEASNDVEEVVVDEPIEASEEDEEIEIVDDEPKQVIIECDKCGALAIIDEVDLKVDEETDLVNVGTKCKFCEEKEGYKIIGSLVPYEAADVEVMDDKIEEPIEEGLFDKFKKKDVLTYSEVEDEYRLSNKAAKDLKKGDYVYVEGSVVKGTAKFERVLKTEEESVGRLNIHTANNVLRSVHEDKKIGIIIPNDMREDCNTTGSLVPCEEQSNAEVTSDEALTENFVDKVRKALNLPAPMVVQLIWEAMLNNEFGEISPELRADLEQAFAQQREWEKRRDEKQAAKAAKKAAKADKKANKLAKDEELEELLNTNIKVDARGFGGSGNAVDII